MVYFNNLTIDALEFAFLQIVWKGTLISIILALLLRVLRRQSARLRYLLGLTSLLAFLMIALIDVHQYRQKQSPQRENYAEIEVIRTSSIVKAGTNQENFHFTMIPEQVEALQMQLMENSNLVFIFWLIGFILFLVRYGISFYFSNRFREKSRPLEDQKMSHRVDRLAAKMHLKRKFKTAVLDSIDSPIVIGFFRPVLLIPMQLVTQLPWQQIDAVLAHELAHIRREDYMINLIQSIIESLFFFHPGMWYISSKIREERENCCDDAALAVCTKSTDYANTLLYFKELSAQKQYSAVAFSGSGNQMLNRIKRMLMKPKQKFDKSDKFIAGMIMIAAIAVISLSSMQPAKSEERSSEILKSTPGPLPSELPVLLPETVSDTIHMHHDKHYDVEDNVVKRITKNAKTGKHEELKFVIRNGEVKALYVDGERVSEDEMPQYQDAIDETMRDLKEAERDLREAQKEIAQIDEEAIRKEVQEAMKQVQDIDWEEIQRDVQQAMKEVNISNDSMRKAILEARKELENIDNEEVRRELEASFEYLDENLAGIIEESMKTAFKALEEIDFDSIYTEVGRSLSEEEMEARLKAAEERIEQIDTQEIQRKVQKTLEELEQMDAIHKEKHMKELEKQLEELEKLELK